MNTYSIKDEQFQKTGLYQEFIKENPSYGYLRIRAYSASEAIPIPGVEISISTIYKNNKIIYYEGKTNDSGVIEKISLPTPKLMTNNLNVPKNIVYEIKMTYSQENINNSYTVNMYEGVCTVQNINIAPNKMEEEDLAWL